MRTFDQRHTTRDTRKPDTARRSLTFHFSLLSTPYSLLSTHFAARTRAAFTLIEMLIVISIISVLLGLLYGSLERARTFSRRAVAYTEVKNIETAFKQYYAHYHDWPSSTFQNALGADRLTSGDDGGFTIDAMAATMLQGTINDSSDTEVQAANPDRIPFIEFARKNSDSIPINPFRLSSGSTETRQYKVLFDLDNDNEIQVRDDTANIQTNVYASVAVWTLIPGAPSEDNTSATVSYEVIGSWHTFSK